MNTNLKQKRTNCENRVQLQKFIRLTPQNLEAKLHCNKYSIKYNRLIVVMHWLEKSKFKKSFVIFQHLLSQSQIDERKYMLIKINLTR